ncbi:MAG: anti-sigma factor family protein, partial [Acidobacteriota bacterium]
DLSVRRRVSLGQHLASCATCRSLENELHQMRGLFRQVVESEAGAGGFRSIRGDLANLLDRPTAPVSIWWQMVPVAGMLAMAGFLLLSGSFHDGGRRIDQAKGQMAEATLWMSPSEDASAVILTIENPGTEPHLVAVSSRSDDFRQARTFKIEGGKGLDPIPTPAPGEVYFYRID